MKNLSRRKVLGGGAAVAGITAIGGGSNPVGSYRVPFGKV